LTIAADLQPLQRPYSEPPQRKESLAFRVRLAATHADVLKAVRVRASAYGRHVPAVGEALREPEPDDARDDVVIVIAESKLDGTVLGSMRLQPNFHRPLRIEGETELPARYRGGRLVEFMRLTVTHGTSGRLVMPAIAKASYEICHRARIDYALVAGRHPVSLMYQAMQFDDVLGGASVKLSYAAGVPHNIFCLPIGEADARWRRAGHSLYPFMAHTEHPDIAIDWSATPLRRFAGH
jgi:hypothetical protein